MSCAQWRDLLSVEKIDRLSADRRERFLIHLQECTSCRRAAATADPTVVFSLLPEEPVEKQEIEEIRRTVQTMRRVRALEASWSRRARQGLAVGAFAAAALLVVFLLPDRPDTSSPNEVPFAGAVGLGSGLVNVPQQPNDTASVELQVALARSARVVNLASSPALETLSHLSVTASAEEQVERNLGSGYRIRFRLPRETGGDRLVLQNFQLLQSARQGEESLFTADLEPLRDSPLILGVPTPDQDGEQLWLLLTYSTKNSVAR